MSTLILRIGTIVVSEKHNIGFYLSENKILALNKSGELVITKNDVFRVEFTFFSKNHSVACFEQMLRALDYKGLFRTQFDMLNFIFNSSNILSINELITFMQEKYDALYVKVNTQTEPCQNFNNEFNEKRRKFMEQFKKQETNLNLNNSINIFVCGKSEVGKTSIIQAVTDKETVPDSAIDHKGESDVTIYAKEVANFFDCHFIDVNYQYIQEKLKKHSLDKMSQYIIWYCVDATDVNLSKNEINTILSFKENLIVIVTKSDLIGNEQLEIITKKLLEVVGENQIVLTSAVEKTGLNRLIDKTKNIYQNKSPKDANAWGNYYQELNETWQSAINEDADSFIAWGAGRAGAIALVPLPLADVGPLIANEAYMIYKLAKIYGIPIDNSIITMLLGVTGGSIVGKIGASFLPFLKVPIAAAVTYGVGKAAKAYFESGMTLSLDELKNTYKIAEKEGKRQHWDTNNSKYKKDV